MPTIQIPRLGQQIVLMDDWEVELKTERSWRRTDSNEIVGRNGAMAKTVKGSKFTLPKGHILRVERIYIRASGISAHEFDSVTFRSMESPKGRFFVPLDKVNGLRYSNAAAVVKEQHTLLYPKGHAREFRSGVRFGASSTSKAGLIEYLKKWPSHLEDIFHGRAPARSGRCSNWDNPVKAWVKENIGFSKILENLPPGFEYVVERTTLDK